MYLQVGGWVKLFLLKLELKVTKLQPPSSEAQ